MLRILTVVLAVLLAKAGDAAPAGAPAPLTKEHAHAVMTSPTRHVRGVDKRMRQAVEEGLRRSGTFASLVLALDRTDVIVYIETAQGLPSHLSGRMLLAAGPEGLRYLRIQVAADPDVIELIALVGHELQHALEVANAPSVRDQKSLAALYEAIGHTGTRVHYYDTAAAQDAGRRVRTELRG